MIDQKHLWEQWSTENTKQYTAFVCFLETRSIQAAWKLYKERTSFANKPRKPTKAQTASGAFKDWFVRFSWQERVEAFDLHQRAKEQEITGEQRAQFLKTVFEAQTRALQEIQGRFDEASFKDLTAFLNVAADLSQTRAYNDLDSLRKLTDFVNTPDAET